MPSGDTIAVLFPIGNFGPTTDFPSIDFTAAPFPILDYDDGTDETSFFAGWIFGQYDGSSALTVTLAWKFTTFVGSQTCDWEVSFYHIADDVNSVEAFTFAAAQTVLATEASATGELDYATIAFTNAQADGIQPNSLFVLRVVRDASGGTASPGDAELHVVEVRET